MRRLVLASLLAACSADDAAAPVADGPAGGKGDDPTEVLETPRHRRDLGSYECPEGLVEGIPVAFFDADSTLRVSKSGSVSANGTDDVNVLPFAAQAIADLRRNGYLVAIVSNQAGIASGHITFDEAEGALAFTASQLARLGGAVHYFDMAESRDEYRKPDIGMAIALDDLLWDRCGAGIFLDASLMVGDSGYKVGVDGPHPDGRPADDFSNADRGFAENLDIPFHEPTDYFDWRAWEVWNLASEDELRTFLDVLEADAERLAESGDDDDAARAEALRAEVSGNRAVNGL